MRTAIISDLHLGAGTGEDVLREPALRRALFEEIGDADRVVLLGDAVELRDLPLGVALASARPFFEELGAALDGREVVLVPGNHDHRFAEPLLDELSLSGPAQLSLEHLYDPSPGPTAQLATWLGGARLRLAYPGIWLRDDVYATHGHYMDPHLSLPRAECLAAAIVMRFSGPVPDPAEPSDYERVLRPIYGLGWGIAQVRPTGLAESRGRPSEAAWRRLSGNEGESKRGRRLTGTALRAAFPVAIKGVNRLLRADFQADISAEAIFYSGVAAATEMAARLGVDGGHVITGHSHRGGPSDGEAEWKLPGGGRLHNTGNWIFASIFHHPGRPPGPYWPGTVTWLEDEAPPRRVQLLTERSHREMTELIEQTAEGRRQG
ncbi:MAG TPA: metallophosphoesterase [Solirubrobacterales bacterium]|nr:metallophosphoesterase [Solirubrobacterales bacterium]